LPLWYLQALRIDVEYRNKGKKKKFEIPKEYTEARKSKKNILCNGQKTMNKKANND